MLIRSRQLKRQLREAARFEPRTAEDLHRLVETMLGLHMPRVPIVPGNSAPFDYLSHVFFEGALSRKRVDGDAGESGGSGDCVVWACRGGGKTMLGAVATLLDLLFKPGIQVRVLGGSLEQSSKMYGYLRQLLDRTPMRGMVDADATMRRIALANGSTVELLAGSQRSVRGQRIHRLRCDEVDEIDADVWQAAQLVTRSGMCGDRRVAGSVEALSTMHRRFGLMSQLTSTPGGRVFRWSAMDVIERCPPRRDCETCKLWPDCRGAAKHADGFVPIEDLLVQRDRVSDERWATEMMCARPRTDASVYPAFDAALHVTGPAPATSSSLICGCDFGMRHRVWLWARFDGARVEVFDESAVENVALEAHLDAIEARGHGAPAWVGIDPAGRQRSEHTGLSSVAVLRRRGYRVAWKTSRIDSGIELVRRRLDQRTLLVAPRCTGLIQALSQYHFDPRRPHDDSPVKDGPDHFCDALRYLLVNLDAAGRVEAKSYF